ncbi:MAG: sulfotransferase [Proteobacteria bacterium]|nr:sulfotransferase [Pseudomonadota bacterium]
MDATEIAAAIARARQALQRGDAVAAERTLRPALADRPDDAEALRLLGMAQNAQGDHRNAAANLRRAVGLDPHNALAFNSLGSALGRLGDKPAAAEAFARACALAPRIAQFHYNLGKVLSEDARSGEALVPLREAVALDPGNLPAQFLLAHEERVTGDTQGAIGRYRALLDNHPERAEAWLGLAGMQRLRFSAHDVADMERVKPQMKDEDDSISIRFALARGYEDLGRFAEAFAMYEEANARVRSHFPWDARHFTSRVSEFLGAFQTAAVDATDAFGSEVVFIVSLPRSGSSLTEQILASHPLVDGAGELRDLPAVIHAESARRGREFPAWVAAATPADWRRLGADYLQRTARWRERHPHFTDKAPDNWRFVGAIMAMLPGARVVICRRDPVETCLACFRQLFARGGQAFSYDLDDLAAYWQDFDRAARHWQRLHPDRVRTQSYEALIAEPEAQIRALLGFCGLPFDPACLNFHETRRNIATASAAQVREPLRRDSARAPAYGVLLEPLRRSLRLSRPAVCDDRLE